MPGRFFLRDPARLGMVFGVDPPDDPPRINAPRANIAPGQEIWVWTGQGLAAMRWGIIPVGRVNARGRPVMETIINARSETVFDKSAFAGTGRAVIPVEGWYEWTGARRRKTAWAIRAKGRDLLFFAAITDIWSTPSGLQVPQVAAVTCEPNADVASVHHRMGVLLRHDQIPLWLGGDVEAAKSLMVPWPEGQLEIAEAVGVDWSGP